MEPNFSVPAEDMLEDARTMKALFDDDVADFTAKDPDLDAAFAADMLDSIEESEGWETAETRQDQQEQETEDVLVAMKTGNQTYIIAKYYIEKAFSAQPKTLKKFGLDNFTAARNRQPKMILFLRNLHTLCEDPANKAELLAAGMTQLQIDAIGVAVGTLATENTEQNKFIKETPEATAERITQYNSTFAFMQQINRASKIVYYGNVVKLNQYLLPHGSQGADFNAEGKVTDGSNNGAPLKGVKVRCEELNIETYTNFYGNWGFTDVPVGIHKFTFTLPGYTTVDHNATFVQNGSVKFNMSLSLAN
ncbi:MAG: carboxypeptidase-like regulatory domain-containing protein [Bacteroidota bacterium]